MEAMGSDSNGAERMKPLQERLAVIGPLLDDYRVHVPTWAVAATRVD
jgi:hypothetical protein